LYLVNEEYPGARVIEWISDNLKTSGWQELPNSYFNPQLDKSSRGGWVKIIDERGSEKAVVHQMSKDWTDANGNILSYGFVYSYPFQSQPNLSTMRIIAIFTPAELAKQRREAAQRALGNPQ
jgi:hypothetical protein